MKGFRHVVSIEVRFRDLDAFGHVNNAVVLSYVEAGRLRYLLDLDLRQSGGGWNNIPFILAHVNCDFRQPISYGQIIEVGTRTVEIKRSSLRMEHRVEADGKLAAEGYGIIVHYDYTTGESIPIPPDMRDRIENYEQGNINAQSG